MDALRNKWSSLIRYSFVIIVLEQMHTTQNSRQVFTAGPSTWQPVNPGTTVSTVTSNEPARRGGASGRICSSIFQAILAVLLMVFGIIAVSLVIPDRPILSTSSFTHNRKENLDRRDRQSWGIWCGVVSAVSLAFFINGFNILKRVMRIWKAKVGNHDT